jgi:tRNA dimethylallyltransferase
MSKFIFVVGPTASGKSDWALREAEKNKGVIFNCDSVQLYQKVHIGAAKPNSDDMKRVPHFLYDLVPPPQEITSGDYRELFLKQLNAVDEGTPIYVVGGTGFYFLALERGLYEIEEASVELKKEIEIQSQTEGGLKSLFEEVKAMDPVYATKLHLNDVYRITRAVEILRSNPGKKISELIQQKKESKGLPGAIEKVGMRWSVPDLEKRIRIRARSMLQQGLIEETEKLLGEGLRHWAPLRSVGYKEVVQYLSGELSRDQLEEQIVIATRQLAKKQRTWFQRDPEIKWLDLPEK